MGKSYNSKGVCWSVELHANVLFRTLARGSRLTVCYEILLIFLQVSHVGLTGVSLGLYGLGLPGSAW